MISLIFEIFRTLKLPILDCNGSFFSAVYLKLFSMLIKLKHNHLE